MALSHTDTVYTLFQQQADSLGDATALQALNAVDLSYRGLMAQLDDISHALAAWGIGRGDRVLIQVPNGPEAFTLLHGVGAIAVALLMDPRAGRDEIEYFLRFTEPKALILQAGVDGPAHSLARKMGVRVIEIVPTPEQGAGTLRFFGVPPSTVTFSRNGPDDLSYLIPTSGTTAQAKLVPKTQRAMVSTILFPLRTQFRVLGEIVPIRTLNYLPMHIVFGSMMVAAALASGGSAACMPAFDPEKFYTWLDLYRPIQLIGPPAILEQLLALAPQHPDVLSRHSLRYVSTGASALTEATRAELGRVFHVPIVQTYGMTEVDIVAQLILPAGNSEPYSATGQVEDPDTVRVMNSSGAFLPPGEVGEIVVRYPFFTGYWRNPEADAEAFIDGWFRTGDEGTIDVAGNLALLGRLKEVINSGGAKVSPQEVEAVLLQHPQVKAAAVFGLKNPDVGEIVAAAVVGAVSERELRKFASERLPFYKVPTRIILVEAIPTGASGKFQRNRLAEILGLT